MQDLRKRCCWQLIILVTVHSLSCKSPTQPVSTSPCVPDSLLAAVQLTSRHTIRAVHFVTPLLGWIVASRADSGGPGHTSTIYKTEDGGSTWQAQKTGIRRTLRTVWFFNQSTGLVAGDGGVLLQTFNGGRSWIDRQFELSMDYANLYFDDRFHGWLVGIFINTSTPGCYDGLHAIYKTMDGGTTWTRSFEGNDGALRAVFSRGRFVWTVGGGVLDNFCPQLIVRSTDGGTTWISQRTGINGPLSTVRFWNDSVGFAGGDMTVGTSDTGENWAVVPLPLNQNDPVVGMQLKDARIIRAVRMLKVDRTIDNGQNWTTEWSTGYAFFFTGSFFLSDSLGWAIGTRGNVVRFERNQWIIVHYGN